MFQEGVNGDIIQSKDIPATLLKATINYVISTNRKIVKCEICKLVEEKNIMIKPIK